MSQVVSGAEPKNKHEASVASHSYTFGLFVQLLPLRRTKRFCADVNNTEIKEAAF